MATGTKTINRRRARTRFAVQAAAHGRPRLSVFRSGRHIYAQVISDAEGKTLAAASSIDADLKGKVKGLTKETAAAVGKAVAERAVKAGVTAVIFDRGAFRYHGRIKALADAARESGLQF
jgi:large subunit ribosomal protein L18